MNNKKSFIITFQLSLHFLAIASVLLITFPALGQSQSKPSTIEPVIASFIKKENYPVYDAPLAEETCDMLYLTGNKSRILHLNRSVRSIKINNPDNLTVFIKNSRKLYILAKKKKGITHFTG